MNDLLDGEKVSRALAEHQRASMGLTRGSNDQCRCGARVAPVPGDAEISIRRDMGFADHQTRAVLAALGDQT